MGACSLGLRTAMRSTAKSGLKCVCGLGVCMLAMHSLTDQEMAIGLCRADLCKASCCRESCSSSCFCWVMLYLCTNTAGLLSTGSCTRPTYHTHVSLAGHARWLAVTQASTQLVTVNWACSVDCDVHKQVMLGYQQPYSTQCKTCQRVNNCKE